MKRFLIIWVFILVFSRCYSEELAHKIHSISQSVKYFLCIDGGGSKTTLQVIDLKGEVKNLNSNGYDVEIIIGPSGNINALGKNGMEHTFNRLFDELKIDDMLKQYFMCENIQDLIAPVHSMQIPPDQIAALTKLVFKGADLGDEIAKEIILDAARNLGILLKNILIQISNNSDYEVYLIGGIFLSESADDFIFQINQTHQLQEILKQMNQNIKFNNISKESITVFAMKNILQKSLIYNLH